MSFIGQYSRRILSFRQKIILFGAVSASVFSVVGTYLIIEFFLYSMEVAVADRQPHVRVYLEEKDAEHAEGIKTALSKHKDVVRCDVGHVVDSEFYVISRDRLSPLKNGGYRVCFEENRRIVITAYAFDSQDYIPPVLLENVYSDASQEVAEQNPEDAPIAILNDRTQNEYCIVNKRLTKIFPRGPTAYADRFEVFGKKADGASEETSFLTAGYIANNPLSEGSEAFKIFTRTDILPRFADKLYWRLVVDCSLRDRSKTESLREYISTICSPERIETWQDANPQAEAVMTGLKTASYMGACVILFLAILGIGVLVSMLVIEKSRQLSILYAIGLSARGLRMIFLYIGLRVAVVSIVVGTIVAVTAVKVSFPWLRETAQIFCPRIQDVGLVYSWGDFLVFVVSVVVFCMLVSWLPTRKITKSDPIKYLRNE